MRLLDLDPFFVRYEKRDGAQWTIPVTTLAEAQGMRFLCPKCFAANKGSKGTHQCSVTFVGRGATDEQGSHNADGKPVRWAVTGTTFKDLTTTPSIQIIGDCGWHGFITAGDIT